VTKLIVMVGLPGSGKTKMAREIVSTNPPGDFVALSRDDIRDMLHDEHSFSQVTEEQVNMVQHTMAEKFLKRGVSVVIHDLNLRMKYRKTWAEIAARAGAEYEQVDLTGVPLDVCVARAANRQRFVPESVISELHSKFIKDLKGKPMPWPTIDEPVQIVEPYEYTPGLPWIVLVDIDGTVAKMNGRSPHEYDKVITDLPNQDIVDLVRALHYDSGLPIVYMSGRPDSCRYATEEWVYENVRVMFENLFMRKTGDYRKDDVVKLELFNQHIRGKYNVAYVLDDRNRVVEMWRKLGLTCLQVAEGNF
jgi:predicted kinase